MKRRFIFLMAFCFSFAFSVANADEVTAKIISYGIFTFSDKYNTLEATETFSGKVHLYLGQPILAVATNQIPAKIGTTFGFIYEVSNLPVKNGEEVELVKTVKTPAIKKPDGTTSIKSQYKIKRPVLDGRAIDYYGFGFDYDYELAPGVWEFEISYEGKILCTQTFTVAQK